MALLVKQWLLLSSGIFLAHALPKGLFYFPFFVPFVLTLLLKELDTTLTMFIFVNKIRQTGY